LNFAKEGGKVDDRGGGGTIMSIKKNERSSQCVNINRIEELGQWSYFG